MLVGVTGGIGSGKSTLCGLFASWGACVVDADRLGHRALESSSVRQRLQEAFGPAVVLPDGQVDRAAVSSAAFADEASWQALNAAVRPTLEPLLWEVVEQAAASAPDAIVVVDAPLLYEWGSASRFRAVVAVRCDEAIRIARVRSRTGMSEDQVRQRMRYQLSEAARVARADYVIENSGTLDELRPAARRVWDQLQALREGSG